MIRIILVMLCFPLIGFAQCDDEIETYVTGFTDINVQSFSFLDDKLNNVKIVGLGEDTHGTAEYAVLTKELFRYLSLNHGFKILIIEDSFGEVRKLNDYIQTGQGDLSKIILEWNWRYYTEEFRALVDYLKVYNENHPQDRVFIYGAEMQYVSTDVKYLEDFLLKVDHSVDLARFKEFRTIWWNISEDDKADWTMAFQQLRKFFNNNREQWISKTNTKAFHLAEQHLNVINQFVTVINQNNQQRFHDFRDIYMSENIQWILNFHEQETDDIKALYWAHNAHVGDWVKNGIVDVAGHQLKKVFREQYYNIFADFGTGKFSAYPSDAGTDGKSWKLEVFEFKEVNPETFTYCLKTYGKPNAFLDLKAARNNKILNGYDGILNQPLHIMSGAGAQYWNREVVASEISDAFDAIIYIDNTKPITRLKE